MSIHNGALAPDHVSQMAFFCGHSEACDDLESDRLYAAAVANVDRYFAVVGVLEYFQESLEVLEAYLPRFFAGARRVMAENEAVRHVNRNSHKPFVDPAFKAALAANLTKEIDFYHYCRQRLRKQYAAIKL